MSRKIRGEADQMFLDPKQNKRKKEEKKEKEGKRKEKEKQNGRRFCLIFSFISPFIMFFLFIV